VSGPIITIFVRHKPGCKYAGDEFTKADEFTKRCTCPKHFRWSLGGKQFRRKAGTRSWAEAEENKAKLMAQLSGKVVDAPAEAPDKQTIRGAKDIFVQAKEVRRISAGAVQRYRSELARFVTFCENAGVYTVDGINMVLLLNYKATWPSIYKSSTTQLIVQKRLSGFLHFCRDNGWIKTIPKLDPVKVSEPPTLPLSEAEYTRLLKVLPKGPIRAIVQLMRWSGLAVRDASCLKSDGLLLSTAGVYSVNTARQKTGVFVYVPIQKAIAAEILAAANKGEDYLFWIPAKEGAVNFAREASLAISAAFTQAKIHSKGHMVSHRLRDTFAVDLLQKGVPMEEVSKMLGHESITTTEKHYAAWAKGRQDRVNQLVMGTWKK
jgi:integrase/recombinase XerD